MHPALSVILFTTLSGSGYGLLAWLGARAAFAPALDAEPPAVAAYIAALLFVTVGLAMSLGHLGKPLRAWRAFSQWRSSWLSREGVVALATYIPALALLASAWDVFPLNALPTRFAGVALCVGALGTVACTAMIYASVRPVAAWRNGWVVSGHLGFALLGGAWLAALLRTFSPSQNATPWLAATVILVLSMALLVLKLRYWRDIDATPYASTAGQATGLAALGTVRTFEAPHTEANYLLREMGFVLARRHGTRLRRITLLTAFALPPIALAGALAWPPGAVAALLLAALSFQCGAFVERWLFFAQARHTVTLYYRAGES